MFFLLDSTATSPVSLGFGDWPAWIALIVAVAAPLVTTIFTNRHQRKLLEIEQRYERSKSCDKLISELAHFISVHPSEYRGFSKDALEATRYFSQSSLEIFVKLSSKLAEYARVSKEVLPYDTISEIPLYLLPKENEPESKKLTNYIEICMFLINELKNAT